MQQLTAMMAGLILVSGTAFGQSTDTLPAPPPTANDPAWSATATAMAYFIPDDQDYLSPTITADRGPIHLEARYNYEGLSTGSVWLGYNFSAGEKLQLEFTPMIGGVFGDTAGVAPGFRASLSWRRLEFYSESEVVFDTGDRNDSFIYTWTELAFSPADWFRLGAVAQRTRAYETNLDIQRGVLAGFSVGRVDATAYVFNWGWTKPTYVFAVAVAFP